MSEDKILSEDDISMGFRSPLYCVPVCIPECNVCIYRTRPGRCEIIGETPEYFRFGTRHDCPDAVLDVHSFIYPEYEELYPEECKQCKKK